MAKKRSQATIRARNLSVQRPRGRAGLVALRRNKLTMVFQRDGKWIIGRTPDVRGAFGQGKTLDEAARSLLSAVADIARDYPGQVLR